MYEGVRHMKKQKQANPAKVIDMTDRIQAPDIKERIKNIKVRLDLEQAKVAVSTSLLSIVILVTMANNSLLNGAASNAPEAVATRGIASVQDRSAADSRELISDLAKRELSPGASVGRRPSSVDKF